ncbi:MAG: acyl-CoA thioesterase [Candidatus Parvarchaeota archaeon]|nr:acyl-CoA thioesterase [Candidatus Parvarchaeota archaeon]
MENEFIFNETVRIYDTDAEGIVHYAGYYRFFTDALEQFANERTGRMFPLINKDVWFVVVESNAKYYKSARAGDFINVGLLPKLLSKKAIRFNFSIRRDGELLCEGYIVQVAIDKDKWKAVPIPKDIIDKLLR